MYEPSLGEVLANPTGAARYMSSFYQLNNGDELLMPNLPSAKRYSFGCLLRITKCLRKELELGCTQTKRNLLSGYRSLNP